MEVTELDEKGEVVMRPDSQTVLAHRLELGRCCSLQLDEHI